MKKIILIFSLGFISFLSFAQKAKSVASNSAKTYSVEARAEDKTNQLDKIVSLDAKQKKQILELNLSLERRTEIVTQNKDENTSKMLEEIEGNRMRMYYSILSETQSQKLKKAQTKK